MISMSVIDPLDARILLALDDDPDATILALARSLSVARNTVQARLKRLAAAGAIRSFGARVDPAALGYPLVAFVSLSVRQSAGDLAAKGLLGLPEVIEIHATTGDADLLVKVVARDTLDLHRIVTSMLTLPGVERSSTAISLSEQQPTRMRALLEAAAGREPAA